MPRYGTTREHRPQGRVPSLRDLGTEWVPKSATRVIADRHRSSSHAATNSTTFSATRYSASGPSFASSVARSVGRAVVSAQATAVLLSVDRSGDRFRWRARLLNPYKVSHSDVNIATAQ